MSEVAAAGQFGAKTHGPRDAPRRRPRRAGRPSTRARDFEHDTDLLTDNDGRSLDDGPGDGGRLAAGEEPAGRGRGQRHADDCENKVEDRHVAQVAEVVVV